MTARRMTSVRCPKIIEVKINPDGPGYVIGAQLMALLAHPPLSEHDSRWRLADRAIGRMVNIAFAETDPGWSHRVQSVIPHHLTMTEAAAFAEHRKLKQCLHDRMGAARVIEPYLNDAIQRSNSSRRHAPLPTVDDEILATLEHEQSRRERLRARGVDETKRFPEQTDNFDNRVLRRSLPVIHVAVAVASAIHQSQKEAREHPNSSAAAMMADVGGPQISVFDIIADRARATAIIRHAAMLETHLPNMATLKPPSIVRILFD